MTTNRALLVLLVIIVLIGGAYFLTKSNKPTVPSVQQAPTTTTTQPVSPSSTQPSSGSSSAMTQESTTVTLTANGFSPDKITVKKGTKVIWVNNSGEEATVNSDPHPVHTDYPPLNLGSFANSQSLSLTFPTAGTYGYHNHLNPSEHGTVTVE